jgi:hypothetical protein
MKCKRLLEPPEGPSFEKCNQLGACRNHIDCCCQHRAAEFTAVLGKHTSAASLLSCSDQINTIMAVPELYEWMLFFVVLRAGFMYLRRYGAQGRNGSLVSGDWIHIFRVDFNEIIYFRPIY